MNNCLENEKIVVGTVIFDNKCAFDVFSECSPDDFTNPIYCAILQKVQKMVKNSEFVDATTICDGENSKFQEHVLDLVTDIATSEGVKYHAKQVKNSAILRNIYHSCVETVKKIERDEDVLKVNTFIQNALRRTETRLYDFKLVKVGKVLPDTLDSIHKAYMGEIQGLRTGFETFDKMTGGFQAGNFIILGGRPKTGKTTLATTIGVNIAKTDKIVAFFSLEMTNHEVVTRMIASQTSINSMFIKTGNLKQHELSRITDEAKNLPVDNFYICDSTVTPTQIQSQCRRLKESAGLDLVIVDYLGLVEPDSKEGNREQQVSGVSRSMKRIAKELNVPVLALAQLNRQVENRENKRPLASDLRESGAQEQDADIISFVYRPNSTDPSAWNYCESEWIIRATRGCPPGTIKLNFNPRCSRFDEDVPD